jgi:hypothetical protein
MRYLANDRHVFLPLRSECRAPRRLYRNVGQAFGLARDGAIIVSLSFSRSTNLNERKLTTPWRQDLKIGRCRFEAG